MSAYALFNVGVGARQPSNRAESYRLDELEAKVRQIREMGAPDDASVIRVAPGSTFLFEVQWIGEASR